MKMMKILMLGAAITVIGSGMAMHKVQAATGNLSAEAFILSAVQVSCGTTMNFGVLVGNVGGTAVLGTDGNVTASPGLAFGGSATEQAGVCTIEASPGYNIDVTATDAVLTNAASDELEVDTFVFNDGLGDNAGTITTQTNAGPPDDIDVSIGATLHVDAGDGAGLYTGTVTVTADYQ